MSKKKKAQEKSLHEKFLEFFLLDTLKIIFWMQNLTQRWTPIGSFSKIRTLFYFQKSAGGALPQYPPISLNILENGKLFWLCQGCEYAWSSYMFHRILKILGGSRCARVLKWHSFIFKGHTEAWIWSNMVQCASIMPHYALISLTVPEYGWILLNVPEFAWKCLNKLY